MIQSRTHNSQSIYDILSRLENVQKEKEAIVTTNCSAPVGKISKTTIKFIRDKKESLEGLATGLIFGFIGPFIGNKLDYNQLHTYPSWDTFFLLYYTIANPAFVCAYIKQ